MKGTTVKGVKILAFIPALFVWSLWSSSQQATFTTNRDEELDAPTKFKTAWRVRELETAPNVNEAAGEEQPNALEREEKTQTVTRNASTDKKQVENTLQAATKQDVVRRAAGETAEKKIEEEAARKKSPAGTRKRKRKKKKEEKKVEPSAKEVTNRQAVEEDAATTKPKEEVKQKRKRNKRHVRAALEASTKEDASRQTAEEGATAKKASTVTQTPVKTKKQAEMTVGAPARKKNRKKNNRKAAVEVAAAKNASMVTKESERMQMRAAKENVPVTKEANTSKNTAAVVAARAKPQEDPPRNKTEPATSSSVILSSRNSQKVTMSYPDNSFLSFENMAETGSKIRRSFQPHNAWCFTRKRYRGSRMRGLFYVKVPKSGSSTIASVIGRIARSHGDGRGSCNHFVDHTFILKRPGTGYYYHRRQKDYSFFVGSVRDPASRALSRVFMHQVSKFGGKPSDEHILNWLKDDSIHYGSVSKGRGGFQLQYLAVRYMRENCAYDATRSATQVKRPQKVEWHVAQVISDYDFIMVSERMDESLVVLGMLLGVNTSDLLTVDTKRAGSYSMLDGKCTKLQKAFRSAKVDTYLKSEEWRAQNYGDYLLHAAANASLDKTIEELGPEKVRAGIEELQRLRKMVNEVCEDKVILPCSVDGKDQSELAANNCYEPDDGSVADEGCGHVCINDFVTQQPKGATNSTA